MTTNFKQRTDASREARAIGGFVSVATGAVSKIGTEHSARQRNRLWPSQNRTALTGWKWVAEIGRQVNRRNEMHEYNGKKYATAGTLEGVVTLKVKAQEQL